MLSRLEERQPRFYQVTGRGYRNTREGATQDEVATLAAQVAGQHDSDVAMVACMDLLELAFGPHPVFMNEPKIAEVAHVFKQVGREVWMAAHGITEAEVAAALAGLQRAQTTLRHLDSLPG